MPGPITVTLPAYPDEGEPCINGTDIALIARCVNGLRELMWVSVEEFGNSPAAVMATKPGCGGQCAKLKLLELAESQKWTPEQVSTVAKSLGLK